MVGVAASTALVTSACDATDSLDLPGLPEIGEEPDHDRVVAGLRDEQAVLDQVVRVRRRHRRLRRALAPTVAVHRAHVALLSKAVDDARDSSRSDLAAPGRVPADPARAVASIIRLEQALAERHVSTAMKSRSGRLARVVAAMSAAAAQQTVALAPLAVVERGSDS